MSESKPITKTESTANDIYRSPKLFQAEVGYRDGDIIYIITHYVGSEENWLNFTNILNLVEFRDFIVGLAEELTIL